MEIDYAALVSSRHPRIGGRRVTATAFRRERYVSVKGTFGHQGPVDLLHSGDLDGQVELQLSSYAAVPYVVSASELAAIVPRHIGGIFASRFDVRVVTLPWPIEPARVAAYTRRSTTEAQQWFADLVVERLA